MDVSVIILTYNQEDTIARSIDSVLQQKTDVEYEIIIGDDCSTDGTREVCEKFQKQFPEKIKYFRRDKNLGLVANYFDCFDKAQGKYIADCSGDDYWVNNLKIQNQFNYLEDHPEVSLVSGLWLGKNHFTDEIISISNAISPGTYSGKQFICDLLTNNLVVNLSSSLYCRDIIRDMINRHPLFFKDKNLRYEDLQIILSCAKEGDITILPELELYYSMGHESVSNPKQYINKYVYSLKTLNQTKALQKYFLPDPDGRINKTLNSFYKKKGDHTLAMAYKAGYKTMNSLEDENPKDISVLESGMKGKIYKYLMKNSFIWEKTLSLFRYFLPEKF